jgi:hypothetical protein
MAAVRFERETIAFTALNGWQIHCRAFISVDILWDTDKRSAAMQLAEEIPINLHEGYNLGSEHSDMHSRNLLRPNAPFCGEMLAVVVA